MTTHNGREAFFMPTGISLFLRAYKKLNGALSHRGLIYYKDDSLLSFGPDRFVQLIRVWPVYEGR
jgi:hypothetical protein